jgi:hypothetical protein
MAAKKGKTAKKVKDLGARKVTSGQAGKIKGGSGSGGHVGGGSGAGKVAWIEKF